MANLLRNFAIYYVILGIDTPLAPDFDSSIYASVKISRRGSKRFEMVKMVSVWQTFMVSS